MARLHSAILDAGLEALRLSAGAVHVCAAEPVFIGELSTLSLGQADLESAPPASAELGRRVTFTPKAGKITQSGIATHWAIVDRGRERILASSRLAGFERVLDGEAFALPAFDVVLPGAAV